MSIHYFADFVGQLAVAGVTLALVTLTVFYILRRSSASLRVLGFTVTLLVHTLIFGLISGVQIHAFMQSGDSKICLLYTSPSPRDKRQSRMPSSA